MREPVAATMRTLSIKSSSAFQKIQQKLSAFRGSRTLSPKALVRSGNVLPEIPVDKSTLSLLLMPSTPAIKLNRQSSYRWRGNAPSGAEELKEYLPPNSSIELISWSYVLPWYAFTNPTSPSRSVQQNSVGYTHRAFSFNGRTYRSGMRF